jgi:hypothetical protein
MNNRNEGQVVQIRNRDDRDHYVLNVFAADLSAAEKILLARLAHHVNSKTGQCSPGSEALAEETHSDERWVRRILVKLEQAGWLTVERRSGYHSNQFTLTIPEGVDWPSVEELKARREAKNSRQNTRANRPGYDRPGCYRSYPGQNDQIPGSIDPPNYLELGEPPKKEVLHKGREENASLALGDPSPARDRLNGSAPGKDAPRFPSQESKQARKEEPAAGATPVRDFAELRGVWQRGHLKDQTAARRAEDQRAYDRARRKAAANVIFAGALKTIQAADAPNYLPTLAVWLDGQGWSKAPPHRARGSKPRGNGHKRPAREPTFAEIKREIIEAHHARRAAALEDVQ